MVFLAQLTALVVALGNLAWAVAKAIGNFFTPEKEAGKTDRLGKRLEFRKFRLDRIFGRRKNKEESPEAPASREEPKKKWWRRR